MQIICCESKHRMVILLHKATDWRERMNNEQFLTTQEVLDLAGVARQTLVRDIKNGVIKCYKIGSRCNRFKKSDVDGYVKLKKESGCVQAWKKKKH